MYKVKIFQFTISNWASRCFTDDEGTASYEKAIAELDSPEVIEDTINSFIAGKKIIDIKIENVCIHRHNNGRGDTNNLIYTVFYEE